MELLKKRNKEMDELKKLEVRAKDKKWTMKCRRCESEFTFTPMDLRAGSGSYGTPDYYAPYLFCPSCAACHVFWGRFKFWNRWVGKYLKLRFSLNDDEESNESVSLTLKNNPVQAHYPDEKPPAPPEEKKEDDEPKGPRIVEL